MLYKQSQLESFYSSPSPAVKCVLLIGTDEGEISMLLKKCAEAVCGSVEDAFRYTAFDMENISKDGTEVYAEYHSQSLMGGRRAVAVKNADNSIAPLIKKMIPDTVSDNLLILTSLTINKKSSLYTWAKDRPDIIVVCSYEERAGDIAASTAEILRKKGLTADPAAMQFLCSRLSPDKKLNQSELDKLEMYLGDRKNITVEDVREVISDVAGTNSEDLCYYVANGNPEQACASLERLLKEGEQTATLVRQLEYHFAKLLSCKAEIESGKTTDDAIKSLRPPLMFYRKPDFLKQLKAWKKDYLLSALGRLYDCERKCKTGKLPDKQLLSFEIMRLSSAAQKFC